MNSSFLSPAIHGGIPLVSLNVSRLRGVLYPSSSSSETVTVTMPWKQGTMRGTYFLPCCATERVLDCQKSYRGWGKENQPPLPALSQSGRISPVFCLPWGTHPWVQQQQGTSKTLTNLGAPSCPGPLQPSLSRGSGAHSPQPPPGNRSLCCW